LNTNLAGQVGFFTAGENEIDRLRITAALIVMIKGF
jgi:hypothetical protein